MVAERRMTLLVGSKLRTFQSSRVGYLLSLIPVLDFFFHPSIFFHPLSLRLLGLWPPKSLDGGVFGGVIGSAPGLGALTESSVSDPVSPFPLV